MTARNFCSEVYLHIPTYQSISIVTLLSSKSTEVLCNMRNLTAHIFIFGTFMVFGSCRIHKIRQLDKDRITGNLIIQLVLRPSCH